MLKKSLTFHTAIYSSGSFLVAIAGLVSFPFITRLLTVEDYGIMNLISLTLMLLVGLGKAGLQRSIVRFSSEARAGNKPFTEADVYLTSMITMLLIVLTIQVIWSFASQLLPLSLVGDERVYPIFILTGMLVIGQTLYSGLSNILVSEKESVTLSILEVVKRYSWLALAIPGLMLAEEKLKIFYIITGAHELVFCAIILLICQRSFAFLQGRMSWSLLRQLLTFGVPLVGFELLSHVFAYIDRVQINYFLGTYDVGLYSAAYNLCLYLQTIFVVSLATAITPMYMDRWETEGRKSTEAFLSLVLRYYLLISIPTAVGITLIGKDLINFLAGDKYVEAHGVIPYVIIGMLIDGITAVMAAGLQIQKRTGLMMVIMGCAAVLNLSLNPILIPIFGIEGAAVTTLVSYAFFTGLCWYFGRKVLTIRIDPKPVIYYGIAASIMMAAVLAVDMPLGTASLFVKASLGAVVFTLVALTLDGELRRLVRSYAGPVWQMLMHRRPAFLR
ncbi:MAG: oligosaccharide flippase family protein [Geminicoccaceae bacterium]